MSKESVEALELHIRKSIDYRDTEQYVRLVSRGIRNGWHAGIDFAAKQQAERDARIKEVLSSYAGEEAIKRIFYIMEGK